MSDIALRLRDGADRFLKWAYKQQYSGPPVISIPAHEDNIDRLMAEAANLLEWQAAEIVKLRSTAREEGRREGLEEAAQLFGPAGAAAIRALKEKQP